MKVIATPILLSVALFSVQVSAGVTLNLGDCIQAHVIDGGERNSATGSSLALSNGIHQLVVDCTVPIGRSDEDSFPESSDAFVLRFAAENTDLTLTAPAIQSSRQLERFNSEGDFRLVAASGEAVKYQADVLKKEGFQVFRDYLKELEAFNRSSSPAAVRFRAPDTAGVDSEVEEEQLHVSGQGAPDQEMVSQMLRYWYLKADKKTRNEWKNWINSRN